MWCKFSATLRRKIHIFVKSPPLKSLVVQYRPFLLFLVKFIGTYIVLTSIYRFYLAGFDFATFEVDTVTRAVGWQVEKFLQMFGANAFVLPNPGQASLRLFYGMKFVARIVEGCNGLSVIILFISFIIAFTGRLKVTAIYIISGSLLIHMLNIVRIALLAIGLYYFPSLENMLHEVVFPLFIYGVVFGLWVIWVNKFSSHATKTDQ